MKILSRRFILIALIVFCSMILIGALVYHFYLSAKVEQYVADLLQRTLATQLKREVTIGSVRLHLLKAQIVLTDLAIARRQSFTEGTLLSAKQATAAVSLRGLLSQKLIISNILIEQPDVRIEFDKQGQSNLPVFTSDPNKKASFPIERLAFPHIELKDARVYFAYEQIPLKVSVKQLNTTLSLQLKDLTVRGKLALDKSELDMGNRGKFDIAMQGQVTFEQNTLTFSALQVQADTSQVTLDGTVRNLAAPELNLTVKTQLALQELDEVLQLHQNLSGMAAFDGTVTGTIPDITVAGHLTCAKGTAWKLDFANVRTDAIYHQEEVKLSALSLDLFDGRVTGAGELSLIGQPHYQAAVMLEQLDLQGVNHIVPEQLPLDGRVSGAVQVSGASFAFEDFVLQSALQLAQVNAYGVHVPQASTQVTIEQQRLMVKDFQAEVFTGQVVGEASMNVGGVDPDFQAAVDLQLVNLAPIMALIPEPPEVSGIVSGSVKASGATFDLDALVLEANVQASEVQAYDIRAKSLKAHAEIRDQVLALVPFSVELFGGQVDGQGKLVLAGKSSPAFDLRATLKNISTQAIMQQFAAQAEADVIGIDAGISGDVALTGASYQLKALTGTVALQGKGAVRVEDEQVPLEMLVKGALAKGVVKIDQLRASSPALNVTTSGTVALTEPTLALAYEATTKNLQTMLRQIFMFLPGIPKDSPLRQLSGKLETLRGTVQGPISDLRIQAEAHLTKTDLVWARMDDLRAKITYQNQKLALHQVQAQYQNAQIQVNDGSIDLTDAANPVLTLPVALKAGDITDYLSMVKQAYPVKGTLSAIKTTISGPLANLQGVIPLKIGRGRAWEQSFDQITGTVELAGQQIRLPAFTVKKNGGTITLSGFFGFDQSFQVDLKASQINFHDIDAFSQVAAQYEGRAEIDLHAAGTVANPTGKVTLRFTNLVYNTTPTEDVICDIVIENHIARAELATFRKKLIALFQLSLTPDLLYRSEMVMDQAAVEQILSLFVKIEGLRGIISGKIVSEGSLRKAQEMSATVKLHELQLDIFGQKLANHNDIDLSISPEKFTVNSLELRGNELGLFAQGKLDFRGNFDLALDGIMDLRPALSFLPESVGITALAGQLQVMCNVRGTFMQPEIEGLAELSNGFLQLRAYPEPIKNLQGKFAFTKGQVNVTRLQGALGGGSFEGYGALHYQGVTPQTFSFDVDGKNITVPRVVEALTLNVSPRLRISGDVKRQKLAGTVMIHNALYTKDLDVRTLIPEKNRKITLEPLQPGGALDLEIFVDAPQNIQVKNKFADLDLRANLRVHGDTAKPQIEGRIEVLHGKVLFGDFTYRILSGILDFVDPLKLNPEMNIQVETTVQEYTITLGVEGSLEQFTLNMRSNPELSKAQITRMLAAGSSSGTNGYNVVTKPLQTLVEDQIERAVKLDRFTVDVDPLLSGSAGNDAATRVTLGKRLFQDLLLTYSTTVGGAERSQVVEVEYQFSDNVSLTARRDEKGEIDASFTFKFKIK